MDGSRTACVDEVGKAALAPTRSCWFQRSSEVRRGGVSRGPVVVLTVDAPALEEFRLTDHMPEVVAVEEARFPRLDRVVDALARQCRRAGGCGGGAEGARDRRWEHLRNQAERLGAIRLVTASS